MEPSSPAAGNAPATPPSPQIQLDLASLSVNQLNQLQAGTLNLPAVTTPPPPPSTIIRLTNADPTDVKPIPGDPTATPPAPAAATPPAATPPAAPPATPPEDQIPETTGRFRIETTNFRDAEVMRLIAKSQAEARANPELRPLTIPEAYERVYGTQAKPTAPAATPPDAVPANPEAKVQADLAAKNTKLAEIDVAMDKAGDEMDMKAVVKLTRERQQTLLDIDRLSREAVEVKRTAEQTEEQNFRQREKENTQTAMQAFPTLADKASADRVEFDRFLALKANDPDYSGIFGSPRWPIILAREFAEARGLRQATAAGTATPPAPAAPPVAGAPVAPQTVVPAAVRTTAATVLTPGGAGPSGATPSPEQLMALLGSGTLTLKQLDALQGGGAKAA